MKLYIIPIISLTIASPIVHTIVDAADGETSKSDQRALETKKFKRTQKMRKQQFIKRQKQNWKEPNVWKEPENGNMIKFALTENNCQFNYVRYDASFPLDPIDSDGTLIEDGIYFGDDGAFLVGSYVVKRCDLYYKGHDYMYHGPMKAGTTESTCLVTSVTAEGPGNNANFDCSISDELTYSKYDDYGNNWGKEGVYLHNANVHYTSTLKSRGKQIGWGNDFKAATIGGTGGGIKASGQMEYKESGYTNQYVHLYYISAPYLEKSLPW